MSLFCSSDWKCTFLWMFSIILQIMEHKTDLKYGAARVCLPDTEYLRLLAYLRVVRHRLPGFDRASSSVFFTSETPHPMSSSNASTMSSMCSKLYLKLNNLNNTNVQNWVSSMVNATYMYLLKELYNIHKFLIGFRNRGWCVMYKSLMNCFLWNHLLFFTNVQPNRFIANQEFIIIEVGIMYMARLMFHVLGPFQKGWKNTIVMYFWFMPPAPLRVGGIIFSGLSVRESHWTRNLKKPWVDFHQNWHRSAPWVVNEVIRFFARSAQGQSSKVNDLGLKC